MPRQLVRDVLVSAAAALIVLLAPARASAQTPYCGPMDVVFVIDDTSSMHDELAAVLQTSLKNMLPQILDQIQNASDPDPSEISGLSDYRLALVTFKDDVTIRANFAMNNRAAVSPLIIGLTGLGGNKAADASDEALKTVIHALPAMGRVGPGGAGDQRQNIDFTPAFRPEALKIIILFTDDPPGGFNDDNNEFQNLQAMLRANEAAAAGIKIVSVFTPQGAQGAQSDAVMSYYAQATHPELAANNGWQIAYVNDREGRVGLEGQGILNYLQACPSRPRPPVAVCLAVNEQAGPGCEVDGATVHDVMNWSYAPDAGHDIVWPSLLTPAGPYGPGTRMVRLTAEDTITHATASCEAPVTVWGCGPEIADKAPIVGEATGPGGRAVTYTTPTAVDENGDPLTGVTCSPSSGALFPVGITDVTCVVTDPATSIQGTNSFRVTIQDTTAPSVALTKPTGAVVGGIISMSATASDIVGVANVQFSANGVVIGHDVKASYDAIWDTRTVVDGTYTLKARACDAAGNCAENTRVVTVSNTNPVLITSLTLSPSSPIPYGNTVTVTAIASGGTGSLEYQFWRYRYATGTWTLVRAWGPVSTYSWTTGVTDAGMYSVQVWVRSVGSSSIYDAYLGTGDFLISSLTPAVMTGLSTPAASPAPAGTPISWTATATGGTPPLLFEFWRYCMAQPGWQLARPYSSASTYSWTPAASDAGMCYVQARVKSTGFPATFESNRVSAGIMILGSNPITLQPPTPNVASPAQYGTAVTWTANALDGVAPLQFQFWRYSYMAGTWTMVRDYTTDNTYTWTPGLTDVGQYVIHVRVRNSGALTFEAYAESAIFTVSGAPPVTITSLTRSGTSPAPAGTPILWTAEASGGTPPLQYEFSTYCIAAGTWTVRRAYASENTYSWTPQASDAGMCYGRVRVRSSGSSLPFEASRDSSGVMITGSNPITVTSLTSSPGTVVPRGLPVTFTATATGGTGALEYQFWRYSYLLGAWSMVRDYNTANAYGWTPSTAEAGQHVIHVRVRSQGKVAFEAYGETLVTVY